MPNALKQISMDSFYKKCLKMIFIRNCEYILLDFSLTVKAAPHECIFRTSQL